MGKAIVLHGAAGIKGYLKRIRTDPCATEVQLVKRARPLRLSRAASESREWYTVSTVCANAVPPYEAFAGQL